MHRTRLFALFLLALFSSQLFGQANVNGSWSPVETWPYRAVHAHVMPNGKVLFWSYYFESLNPQIWDPATDTVTSAAAISYAIFCAGHSILADGRLFVTGGHQASYVGVPNASIYDPFKNKWTTVPDMNAGRWYPTNTTLSNGDVLVISGDIDSNTNVDTLPQVYQVGSNSWRDLGSAQLALPLYPRMFLAPNGQVFEAGPDPNSRYLNTAGTGKWTFVTQMKLATSRDYGSAVMYAPGKIVTMGGGDPATATAETIDLNSTTPTWKPSGSMAIARRQINATVLPDGKVLVTGGSSGPGFDNSSTPVYTSEMWDPATGNFTQLASESIYRGYHSIALLLPDGRVLSAGGNVGGPNAQIYSPPYLFQGTRPTISSAPQGISYNSKFSVGTPDAANITSVSLIRVGTVTHAFNQDQRFMQLNYTQTVGGLTVVAPTTPNLAPPGYYLLFILKNGVPSVAKILQVGAVTPAAGTINGQVTDTSGKPLSGATVADGSGSATTDSHGNYVLTGAPAGTVTVTASDTGFNNNSVIVTVASGSTVTAPVISLSPLQPPAPPPPTPPPAPSVTLATTPNADTVKAGQTASYTVEVTPNPEGPPFNENVAFTCSGLPNLSTCTFNPSTVTPESAAVNVTLTIATTAPSTVAGIFPKRRLAPLGLGSLAFLGMFYLQGRKSRRSRFLLELGLMALILLCIACRGMLPGDLHSVSQPVSTSQPGTAPGTYSVSIVGSSSGQQVASTTVSLTVQ